MLYLFFAEGHLAHVCGFHTFGDLGNDIDGHLHLLEGLAELGRLLMLLIFANKRLIINDMKFELKPYNRNISNEELISDVRGVADKLQKNSILSTEYDKHGKYTSSTIGKRFKGWSNALERAGLEKTDFPDDELLLEELKRIAISLNKETVTRDEFLSHSTLCHPISIERRFNGWSNALKKAELSLSKTSRRYSTEDYYDNLLNIWTHYGRQPTREEMNRIPSKITESSYSRKFGGWRKALEVFVSKMNEEEAEELIIVSETNDKPALKEISKKEVSTTADDQRNISIGLRYKVLSRDKFKCVRCGDSPATDLTCRLHVDHIVPFSKGGKTNLENLQTLCDNCNLGKGNRFSE